MFALISKVAGFAIGWKGMALGAILLTGGAFAAGYYVKDKFCDASAANARVAALERSISALQQDNQLAAANRERMAQLKEQHRALIREISDGKCFTADDLARLRRAWNSQPR